jgi:hypothetical protein
MAHENATVRSFGRSFGSWLFTRATYGGSSRRMRRLSGVVLLRLLHTW